jgi:hypothetical protein
MGAMTSASTRGHTTGPPAENAYAVDPVGVAITTPSQPKVEMGLASTSTTTSIMRSRSAFSTAASFKAHVWARRAPSNHTCTSMVRRSSTV